MRFRPPVLAAVTAALIASTVLVGPVTSAAADEQMQSSASAEGTLERAPVRSADGQGPSERADDGAVRDGVPGSARTIPLYPTGVRVETSASGFTVHATPQCSLATYCKSTFRIPDAGLSRDQVNTRNGYFVSWPSSWSEGRSISGGQLASQACDLVFCYWNWNKAEALGTITRPYTPRPLTATVTSKNDAARTAQVSGTATPNAVIKLNGSQVATADGSSGAWSTTVSGLSVGANTRTFQQFVDGAYKDQKSVSVTIVEPVQPGQITGDSGSVTLARGGTTTGYVTYTPKRAFTTPSGSLVVTAPTGTTFAAGQDTQRGQYLDGSTWRDFAGDSLTGGSRSSDGTKYTFSLGNRNWDVAKDQKFRFGLRIDTPADITTLQGALTGKLTGSITGGTFDTTATTSTTVPEDTRLTTTPKDVDPIARTATLEGTAPTAASTVDVTWTRNGSERTETVRVTGRSWTRDLDGLAVGSNPVRVEAFSAAGASLGTLDVDIDLPAPGFSGEPEFDDDVTKPVRLVGRGVPGATVEVRSGSDVIGTVPVGDPSGEWELSVPAPDRGGVLTLQATQRVPGAAPQTITVPVDYGRAVRITSPGDGFVIPPAFPAVRIVGVAAADARVTLRIEGASGDIGTKTADGQGNWDVTTPALAQREQVIIATAVSRGGNTTTSRITLRPQS